MTILPVSAHAGGSVGGSGSSSGGTSSADNGGVYSEGESGGGFLSLIPILLISGAFTYAGAYGLHKKHRDGHRLMKKLVQRDPIWNEEMLNHCVTETIYAVQYAWMEMDIEKLSMYLTPRLMELWTAKMEWMKQREEVSVMKEIWLKSRQVIGIYDYQDDDRDFVWYSIKASMIDYNQNI